MSPAMEVVPAVVPVPIEASALMGILIDFASLSVDCFSSLPRGSEAWPQQHGQPRRGDNDGEYPQKDWINGLQVDPAELSCVQF